MIKCVKMNCHEEQPREEWQCSDAHNSQTDLNSQLAHWKAEYELLNSQNTAQTWKVGFHKCRLNIRNQATIKAALCHTCAAGRDLGN